MIKGSSDPEIIQKTIRVLGICLLAGILIYLLTKKPEGISVTLNDDELSLSFSSGESFEIRYQDILSVEEAQDLDLGRYVSGIETKNHKFGIWQNNEFGEYNLCIYASVMHYIVVKTAEVTFVLNFESVDATDSFYKAFVEFLQTRQTNTAK